MKNIQLKYKNLIINNCQNFVRGNQSIHWLSKSNNVFIKLWVDQAPGHDLLISETYKVLANELKFVAPLIEHGNIIKCNRNNNTYNYAYVFSKLNINTRNILDANTVLSALRRNQIWWLTDLSAFYQYIDNAGFIYHDFDWSNIGIYNNHIVFFDVDSSIPYNISNFKLNNKGNANFHTLYFLLKNYISNTNLTTKNVNLHQYFNLIILTEIYIATIFSLLQNEPQILKRNIYKANSYINIQNNNLIINNHLHPFLRDYLNNLILNCLDVIIKKNKKEEGYKFLYQQTKNIINNYLKKNFELAPIKISSNPTLSKPNLPSPIHTPTQNMKRLAKKHYSQNQNKTIKNKKIQYFIYIFVLFILYILVIKYNDIALFFIYKYNIYTNYVISKLSSDDDKKVAKKILLNENFWATTNSESVINLIRTIGTANIKDQYGRSLLALAAKHNSNPKLLQTLLALGARVNSRDNIGATPLHYAAKYSSNPDIVLTLINGGADVNAANMYGETPLHLAAKHNSNPETLNVLLFSGADVSTSNNLGQTPLHYAALAKNQEPNVLNALLDYGADINTQDKAGMSALHIAIINFHNTLFVQRLLEYGADTDLADNGGKTPLHYALEQNARELNNIIETYIYKKYLYNKKYLNLNFWKEDITIPKIKYMLRAGMDVTATNKDGWTPFHLAARYAQNPKIIKIFLNIGMPVDITTNSMRRLTPLHLAAYGNQNPEIVDVLLLAGAAVNARSGSGWTPLHYAACCNNYAVVKRLIIAGADVNAMNDGKTPLCLALSNGNEVAAKELRAHGGTCP